MAALSVHNCAGGTIDLRRKILDFSSKALRRRLFAATPPPRVIVLVLYSFAARMVLVTSTSTTASSKERAMSACLCSTSLCLSPCQERGLTTLFLLDRLVR